MGSNFRSSLLVQGILSDPNRQGCSRETRDLTTAAGGWSDAKPGAFVSAHTLRNCCKSCSRVSGSGFVSIVKSGRARKYFSDRETVKLNSKAGAKALLLLLLVRSKGNGDAHLSTEISAQSGKGSPGPP